jgi:tetratricopeptide (TPR) repeat protein
MTETRMNRIKAILNKHEPAARRWALLQEIQPQEVREHEELDLVDLLEFLLANLFTLVEVVALKPDKKGFVRFRAGVAAGEKQAVPFLAQDAFAGHFIKHKMHDNLISYGERAWALPLSIPWRVLIEVEVQLPLPRLSPFGPPTGGNIIIDPRQAFEKYKTIFYLLKDTRLFDELAHLPIGNWTIVGIYKVPETEEEAEEQEKAWQDAQAFDPSPNLPGVLMQMQKMMQAFVEQVPQKIPQTAKSREDIEKIKGSLADLSKSQADMTLMDFLFSMECLASQDLPAAEARLQDQVSRHPGHAPSWNMLGTLWAEQFRWQDARRAFIRATELDPDNPYTRECVALAREALDGTTVQPRQDPLKSSAQGAGSSDRFMQELTQRHARRVTLALALFHFYTGKSARAEDLLYETLSGGGTSEVLAEDYNHLAWLIYARRSNDVKLLELGVNLAQKAVDLRKKHGGDLLPRALDTQGCLLSVLGRYEPARASFLGAIAAKGTSNLGDMITWTEFKRTLKALNDTETFQKFKEYF